MNALPVIALLVLAGVLVALQAPVNAVLGRAVGSAIVAAALSFGVGFAALSLLATVRGLWPGAAQVAAVPLWAWIGGVFGAYFVWAGIYGVSRVGLVTVAAALVLGQIVTGLVVDRAGWFGVPVQPVSWTRLGGAMLVAAGLVLSRF